jgi:NTE family protein
LVLAGAVARGAYEAGAASVLLPALEARGERPTVFIGTSSGAINAAFLAGRADLPAAAATDELVDLWGRIRIGDVLNVVSPKLFNLARRSQGGVLDTGPLRRTINERMGSWKRIADNIDNGCLKALGIVATAVATGRSTVFVADAVHNKPGRYDRDDKKGIDYIRPTGGITVDHVLASAAVPTLFPPIELRDGIEAGLYVDGGMRLNTPIKPAIRFGVDNVVVVSTDPARPPQPVDNPGVTDHPPDWDDTVLQFLQAALVDPLVEDMWRLARVNTLLGHRTVTVAGGPAKRPIGYLFIGPDRRGRLGALAADVAPTEFTTKLLRHLLGAQQDQQHELLSYMLFEPEFFDLAIAEGRQNAKLELARVETLDQEWRTDPLPDKPEKIDGSPG